LYLYDNSVNCNQAQFLGLFFFAIS
jgi:hypothetical protein